MMMMTSTGNPRDVTALANGFDLNDHRESGVVSVSGPTNGPGDSDYFVETYMGNVNGIRRAVQNATDVETGKRYSRSTALAGWTAWTEVNARIFLQDSNGILYVRDDGNDNNDGSTNDAAGAFRSLQGMWDYVCTKLDFNGQYLAVEVRGTALYNGISYGHDGVIYTPYGTGGGFLDIYGMDSPQITMNSAHPGSYNALLILTGMTPVGISLSNLDVTTVENAAPLPMLLTSEFVGSVSVYGITFTNFPQGGTFFNINGGVATFYFTGCVLNIASGETVLNTYAQTSGANLIQFIDCSIQKSGATLALTGAGVYARGGTIVAQSFSFTGNYTGTRYQAVDGGKILTAGGGASYFPGNVAGSSTNGGVYA